MGTVWVSYGWTRKNPLKIKGFLVRETGLEFDQIIHPRSILPHDVEQ